jgi:hypothetical protein
MFPVSFWSQRAYWINKQMYSERTLKDRGQVLNLEFSGLFESEFNFKF